MLTAKQISTLDPGFYSNGRLRSMFDSKFETTHGTVVKERVIYKGKKEPEDMEFIGNRRQSNYRRMNPYKPLKSSDPKFQSNRLTNKDRKNSFAKILKGLTEFFKSLFA